MKRKALLVITATIISVLFVTVSASAKKPTEWTQFAYGTVIGYNDAPSSTILDGYWNLKIQGNKIWLQMNYMEKNLIEDFENSPEGSVDLFEFTFMGQPMVFMEDDVENTLDIFAVMKVEKTWAMFDGTYNPKTWKTWMWFTFDFDAGTVYIDTYPPGPMPDPADPNDPDTYDWDRTGTIIDYEYTYPT